MLTLDEVLAEEMKNPEFKKEWDALEPEFQIIRAIIEGREAQCAKFRENETAPVRGDNFEAVESAARRPPHGGAFYRGYGNFFLILRHPDHGARGPKLLTCLH